MKKRIDPMLFFGKSFFVIFFITLFGTTALAQSSEEYIAILTDELDTTVDPHARIDLKIQIEEVKYNMDADTWKLMAKEAHSVNHFEAEGKCLGNVGFILSREGKRDEAIEYYHRALDIYRITGSGEGIAGVYNDLAGIYSDINELEFALEYYETSLLIYTDLQDSFGMAMVSHNIASQYLQSKDYTNAKSYELQSFAIADKIQANQGIPAILQNLGAILEHEGDIDSALVLFYQGYEVASRIGVDEGMARTGISIGKIYLAWYKKNNAERNYLDSAEIYFLNSFEIGSEMKSRELCRDASFCLMDYYSTINEWESAYNFSTKYYAFKDTLDNANAQKEIIRSQMEYDHNIEKTRADQERKTEKEKADEKAERQFYIILAAGIVVLILIVFVFIIVRKWKETKRQKVIIEHQKELVDEKQKEIRDSINYAQRLQQAILATPKEITKYLPENFLVFKPKDIVAGDFYFFETTDTHIFLAAADCTGHGVPGAMVSVVCSNALMRSVKEFKLTDPGKILDKTRDLIVETFKKSGSDVKDGMDISLLTLSRKSQKIEWAGAYNPLWYIECDEMKFIKPDKQPVGLTDNPRPFKTHELLVNTKTLFFLFTDGMADQFGGPNGKKYKYKSLQNLFVENAKYEMSVQKRNIDSSFENWKGNLEQVDDVCVIGVRI